MLHNKFSAKVDLWIIASLWCISLVIINPLGDFPLNDDWSYGLAVKHLYETGSFRPTGWTSMPLITQAIWGYLFCIPFGFSFETLRLSTLTLSLLGILGAYQLTREMHPSRTLAVIVALTLGFNPIYFALSNTFMTDVPFTVITIFASLFFIRNLRNDADSDLIIGTILVVAATLTRQLGMAVAIAFAISFILKNGFTRRNVLRAAISPALCIGALLIFQQWLGAMGRLPKLYNLQGNNLLHALVAPDMFPHFFAVLFVALLYMGWFLLPVLLFSLGNIWGGLKGGQENRIALLITSMILTGLALILWNTGFLMPAPDLSNIISAGGIGASTLRNFSQVPVLPRSFWIAISAASLLGGALLVIAMGVAANRLLPKLRHGKLNGAQAVTTFLLLSVTIYMAPLLIGEFFDRYLIPVIPFVAASISSLSAQTSTQAPRINAILRLFIVALLIGTLAFSLCSTRDYLTWNRTRWVILNDLMKNAHIFPSEIDGGFEFNGLYLYTPNYESKSDKSWWWVWGDKYMVAFGAVPGYSIIQEYNYRLWLPLQSGSIVLLKKD
jgi:hypothetical protein